MRIVNILWLFGLVVILALLAELNLGEVLVSLGLLLTKYITIPLCIIGLVLCWVWGRQGRNGR